VSAHLKPKRKGAERTALTENLAKLTGGDVSLTQAAAILGGAIDAALEDMCVEREIFWRYANENTWRLWRALEASGTLKEVK